MEEKKERSLRQEANLFEDAATATKDNINPKHYRRDGGIESIDEMEMVFGTEAVMHFCLLNVWKYRYRAADKNGEEDLRKSDWYMKKYCQLKNKDKNTMTITDSGIKIAPWIPATSTTPAITYLNDNKDNI